MVEARQIVGYQLPDGEIILTQSDYCKLRGIKEQSARAERVRGDGPEFIRTGSTSGRAGRVLYRWSAVKKWMEKRTRRSTADEMAVAARLLLEAPLEAQTAE